jgi:hypothetical protein
MAKVSSLSLSHDRHRMENLSQMQKMLSAIIVTRNDNAVSVANDESDGSEARANLLSVFSGTDS